MLTPLANKIDKLPRLLKLTRVIEYYEVEILAEYKAAERSGLYLKKWCASDGAINRFLIVRADQRAVAEYLANRISMLNLLTIQSDGIGFIEDQEKDVVNAVYMVSLCDLPKIYLPKATAFHDSSLRPEWEIVPQNFLFDHWDGKLLAEIEKRYLDVFGFSHFVQPGKGRKLPQGILDYDYDGGYSTMHAYNRIRDSVPVEERAKTGHVSASSPGVLTIDAPRSVANQIAYALGAVAKCKNAYNAVQDWSRLTPDKADSVPSSAKDDVARLCNALGVDMDVILPQKVADKSSLLVAGKLIASYWRRLSALRETDAAEFLISQE